MKTKFLLLLSLAAAGMLTTGCHSPKPYRPHAKIIRAFNSKYPKAEKIEWETQAGYYIAECRDLGVKKKIWFDESGKWKMTETELKYRNLPQLIRENFERSIYNSWEKDGMEKIERTGMKPVYLIEVEKEGQHTGLYYGSDGQLAKAVYPAQGSAAPQPLDTDIQDSLKQRYPEATVIEIRHDKGKLEIAMLDQHKPKEVIFNGSNWLSTSWEVSKAEVPSAVMNAFRRSDYGKYRINSIHFYETPARSFYRFELEHGSETISLPIEPDGAITM